MELTTGSPRSVGFSARRIRYLQDLAQSWVTAGVVSALVVMVARRGVIVVEDVYGRIAPDRDETPSMDTLFPLGSATTLLTITAAMILVDDGLLGLNRPVTSYLPEFVGEGKQHIMVHHLLRHTSGLRDSEIESPVVFGPSSEAPSPDSAQHPRIREFLESIYRTRIHRPPDTEMSYGHCSIELLGEIIRRVSGKPVPEFAEERIFAPLGMKDTGYTVPATKRHRIVKRPPDAPHAALLRRLDDNDVPVACFSAFTTPRDMAVFGQMFLNRGRYGNARILSPASISEMTRNQVPGLAAQYRDEFIPEASWGLGWNVHGRKRALGDGTLQSPEAFYQGNAGGPLVWVDPIYEVVGIYFCVVLQLIEDEWPGDLFMNAVTASIE